MADAQVSSRLRPIIRVFVSSTFSDLKVERDALQRRVFQKIEQRCQKDGFQFQAIDLRWGVSTEAGLDHRTMRICFEELRRSQEVSPEPNFLILLGDRYGWRPLLEEISAEEFRRLELAAAQSDVTGQTQAPADVLRRWYRRDENALTPVYILQRRREPDAGDPDGTDYTTAAAWQAVQDVLWLIINRAFPATELKDRFAAQPPANDALPSIVRFQASATEQEIWCGALSVPNASQHVLAFFRYIDPPQGGVDAGPCRDFFDVVSGQIDPIPHAAQEALKAAIKQRLGDNAVEMPAARLSLATDPAGKQSATVSTDHLDLLCSEVETRLSAIIDGQIQEYWREAQSSGQASDERRTARELEIERDEHFRFGRERGPKETFVGRQDQIQKILTYVENDSTSPLVIHGASGCGKTALLARAVQEISAKKSPVVRFIGITPRSSDLRTLLSSLCQELRQRHPLEEPLPADVRELIQEFRKNLAAATADQPIILFLDALDQLSDADSGRRLFWIPFGPLPNHVKLVVSCLSDRDEKDPVGLPYVSLQRRNLPADNMLNVDALSRDDAKTLLFDRWLRTTGRTVNDAQRRLIEQRLETEACRQPLYLKLLFEEAKLWRSYDADVKLNEPDTSNNYVTALLQQLFDRLSLEVNHGKLLVQRALGYIAAARHGLTETEILEVLFADDPGYRTELAEASKRNNHTLPNQPPRIPIAIWSRLRSDLAPYLTERAAPGGNVLTLYHRKVAEWIKARFVDESDWKPHGRLADYFEQQPIGLRKVIEFPWQLNQSNQWQRLLATLTDAQFFEWVWLVDPYDIRAYWAQLERKSPFRIAQAYREAAVQPNTSTDFLHHVAILLAEAGNQQQAAELWVSLALAFEQIGNSFGQSVALDACAAVMIRTGKLDDALELLRQQEGILRRSDSLAQILVLASCLGKQGSILHAIGSLDEAMERHVEQERIARRIADKGSLTISLNNQAIILAEQEQFDEAMGILLEVESMCQQSNDQLGIASAMANRAQLFLEWGRLRKAESLCEQAAAVFREYGQQVELASLSGLRARVLQKQGRFEESLVARQEQEQLARQAGITEAIVHALAGQAQILWRLDRREEAATRFREAIDTGRQGGYVSLAERTQKMFEELLETV